MGFALLMFCLTGCYAKWSVPMSQTSTNFNGTGQSKVGKGACREILWIYGDGDCSIATVMKNANMTKVHHVDTDLTIILFGAFSELNVVAYGD